MFRSVLFCALVIVPLSVLADSTDQPATYAVDPAVKEVIADLGLRESTIASRDLPGWSQSKKIVLRRGRRGALAEYQALAPDVDFVMVESLEQARKEAVDAQAVLGYCDEEILSNSPGLFWIQVYSAGDRKSVV